MVVDLPAPFGPRKPTICPFFTWKLMPSTALSLPKRLWSLSTSMVCCGESNGLGWLVVFRSGTLNDGLLSGRNRFFGLLEGGIGLCGWMLGFGIV